MARVNVSVEVPHDENFVETVEAVRAAGVTLEYVLDVPGVVGGVVEEGDIPALGRLPGVGDVEIRRGAGF